MLNRVYIRILRGVMYYLDAVALELVLLLKYSCEYPVTTALQGRLALPAIP